MPYGRGIAPVKLVLYVTGVPNPLSENGQTTKELVPESCVTANNLPFGDQAQREMLLTPEMSATRDPNPDEDTAYTLTFSTPEVVYATYLLSGDQNTALATLVGRVTGAENSVPNVPVLVLNGYNRTYGEEPRLDAK